MTKRSYLSVEMLDVVDSCLVKRSLVASRNGRLNIMAFGLCLRTEREKHVILCIGQLWSANVLCYVPAVLAFGLLQPFPQSTMLQSLNLLWRNDNLCSIAFTIDLCLERDVENSSGHACTDSKQ